MAEPGDQQGATPTADEVEADIRRTREELAGTVDAIAAKADASKDRAGAVAGASLAAVVVVLAVVWWRRRR